VYVSVYMYECKCVCVCVFVSVGVGLSVITEFALNWKTSRQMLENKWQLTQTYKLLE
jgi:hypothetical protein